MDVNLYRAAREGDLKFLEDFSYDVHDVTHQKNNIVHVAARHGKCRFVQKSLDLAPKLFNQLNYNNDTPLHVAARNGHLAVAEILVNHSITYGLALAEAQEEEVLPPALCQMTNSDGSTALHEALKYGHKDVSLYLFEEDGTPVRTCNDADESALYLAAESCCEEVMAQILTCGYSYSVKGPGGQNVLHAAKHCSEDAVALVLRKRRDLMKQTDDSERTALHSAVLGYCRGFINQILMEDASIACIPDNEGLTPLLRASAMGSWIICRDIIKLCPESVEARDNNGKNALHIFTPWSSFHFKRFLGIKGAKELVNERDNDGNTPLHLAIKSREYQKSRLLIGHTNLKAVNKSGKTALDVCESDWINSHRQRQLATRMISLNASRGRCPDSNGFQYTGPTEFSIKKDEDWRAMSNTLSVVAALLVTVTFSAIFTMPGGYNSVAGNKNLGIATLARKTAFQIFVLSDTVAMCTSIIAVFMSVWAQVGDKDTLRGLTITCLWMIRVALCTTLVAFATGLYSVTADRVLWIAILVIVICFIVPLVSLSGFPLFLGVKGFHRLEVTRQEDDDDQDIAVQ